MAAPSFEIGAAPAFDRKKITRAMREYAIAGTLHFDHLAGVLHSPANAPALSVSAFHLARACGQPESGIRAKLERMLTQHELEWRSFVGSLGQNSFVAGWAAGVA